MKRALLLLALAACPGGDTRVFSASYALRGSLRGDRAVDDQAGGRVTCTVDVDPTDPLDPSPVFTLAVLSAGDGRRQPGLYLSVHGFHGQAAYQLGPAGSRGRAAVFDEATLSDCARDGDTACFTATEGCALLLDSWVLSDAVPPGVRNGAGTGRINCTRLEDASGDHGVEITQGTFTCRASDWTATRR